MRSMRNIFSLDPVDADIQRKSEPKKPEFTFKNDDGSTDYLALSAHYQVPTNVIRATTELGGVDGKRAAEVLADALKRSDNDVPTAVRSIFAGNEDAATALLEHAASLASGPAPAEAAPAPAPRAADNQPGIAGDVARMGAGGVMKGSGAVVEGVGRAVDAINPREDYAGKMVMGEDGTPKLDITPQAGPSSIVTGATEAADKLRGIGEAIQQGVSDASFEAIEGSTPDGNLFDPSTWSLGENPSLRGYVMLSADVLGSMAPVIVSALATGPAGAMAVGGAQSAGAGAELARQEIDAAAADLDENGVSRLERDSAYFRELVASGVDRDEALRRTRHAGEQLAALFAAPVGALGGHFTGGVVSKGIGFLAGKGAATRIGGTAALSGIEEAWQEAFETIAARKGVETGSGLDVDLTEGTFGDALLGFLGGAVTGGASGVRGREDESQDPGASPAPDQPPLLPAPQRQLPAPDMSGGLGDGGASPAVEQSSEASTPVTGGQTPDEADTTSGGFPEQPTMDGVPPEIDTPAPNLERPPLGPLSMAAAKMDRSTPPAPISGSRVRVTTPEGADLEAVFDSEDAGGLNLKFENSPWRIPREDIAAGTVSVTPINPMAEDIARRAEEAAKAFEDDAAFLNPPATTATPAKNAPVTETTNATPPVSGDTGTVPTEDPASPDWDALGEDERRSLAVRAFPKSTEQGRNSLIGKSWNDITDQRVRSAITDALSKGYGAAAPAAEIEAAAQEVAPDPTDAQKEAGNYKKGHVKVQGLDISIENAKGAERSGKDANGKAWSVTMPAHYGYIRRTEGADGDHVDVYLGDAPDSDAVYIVNQIDHKTGKFDEHKVLMGFKARAEAQETYVAGFSDGKGAARMGSVTETTMDGFKAWLKDGDQSKPTAPVRSEPSAGTEAPESPSVLIGQSDQSVQNDTPMARAVREAVARGKASHTTKRGKALTGYVVQEVDGLRLVPNTAKEIDKYAFRKDGGFFLREDAVREAFPELVSAPENADISAAPTPSPKPKSGMGQEPSPKPKSGTTFKLAERLSTAEQRRLGALREAGSNVSDIVGDLENAARVAADQLRRAGIDPADYDARGMDREGNWNQHAGVIGRAEQVTRALLEAVKANKGNDLDYPARDEDTGEFESDGSAMADALDALVEFDAQSIPVDTIDTDIGLDEDAPAPSLEEMPDSEIFPPLKGKTANLNKLASEMQELGYDEAQARVQRWKDIAAEIGQTSQNRNKVVISLFDYSGAWSQPWVDAGYEVVRHDIKTGSDILVQDFIYNRIEEYREAGLEVVGVLSACPCTTFAGSGARWWSELHDVKSPEALEKVFGRNALLSGAKSPVEYNVMLVQATRDVIAKAAPTRFHVLENPVGRIKDAANMPEPTARFHPHNFGDPYTKYTQLFGTFDTDLPFAPVDPVEGSKMQSKLRGDDPLGKEARSATPEGFAYAFFMANAPEAKAMLGKEVRKDAAKPAPTKEQPRSSAAPTPAKAPKAKTGNDAPMGKHLGIIDASDDITSDDGRDSPQKNAFLNDATRWARRVAAILEEDGYTRPTNNKGKTMTPVRANRGGIVTSGDVYLDMRTPDGAYSVTLAINADNPFGRSKENGVFINFQIRDGSRFVGQNRYPDGALPPSEMADLIRSAVITAHATDTKRNAPKPSAPTPQGGPRVLVNYVGRDGKTDAERGGPLPPESDVDPKIPAGYELTLIRRASGDEARANGFKPGEPHKAVVKRNSPYGVYDAIEATRAAAIASALRKAERGAPDAAAASEMQPAADTEEARKKEAWSEGSGEPLASPRHEATAQRIARLVGDKYSLENIRREARDFGFERLVFAFDKTIEGKKMRMWVTGDGKYLSNAFHSTPEKVRDGTFRDALSAYIPIPNNLNPLDLFEAASPEANPAPDEATILPVVTYGSKNKLVSADRAAEIRAQLIEKLKNQASAGIDPQILALGAELAVFHIEAGSRKFIDMTRAIAADLGMEPKDLKRYLRSWYNGARDMMEDSDVSVEGMDNADTVKTLLQSGAIDSLSAKLPDPAPSDTMAGADTEQSQDNEAANDTTSDEIRVDPSEPLEGASPEAVSPDAGGQDAEPAGADQGRGNRGPRRRDDGDGDAGTRGRGGRKGRSVSRSGKLKSDSAQPALDFEAERTEAAASTPLQSFVITDDLRLGQGGPTEKFNDNVAAIETLKRIEAEKRPATAAEQKILARYVGWGGLKNAFRVAGTGDIAKGWETKVSQLEALLEPEELKAARNSTRAAHYTSQTVVQGIWKLAERLGFDGGSVLEPSSGTGNFLGLMPQTLRGKSKVMAVEYDSITARIAKQLYPNDVVYHSGFQNVPLPEGQFALAIGNPPFGTDSLYFKHLPAVNRKSIHNQFFQASMHAVAPDGLMTMVVSRYLMDAKDASNRRALARLGTLEGAIRLPDTAFQENARTEVVTDILAFRKHSVPTVVADAALARIAGTKEPEYSPDYASDVERLEANFRKWINVSEFNDPSGSGETLAMNDYFHQHKAMVLGDIAATGTMRKKNELNVSLPADQIEQRLNAAIERIPSAPKRDAVAERTTARFDALAEAMGLAVRGAEPGAVRLDDDGRLISVLEQHDADGNAILKEIEITENTPYSNAYFLGTDGKWRREVDALDETGAKVKQVNADGKKTNLNVKEIEVIEDLSTIHSASKWGAARVQQLRDMLPIRDAFRRQVELESQDAPEDRVEANRKKLAEAYRAFKSAHGPLHQPRIRAIADQMPDGGLVLAVEDITSKPDATRLTVKDADILSGRVLFPPAKITSAKSLDDAISISLSETGGLDLDRMAALLGTDVAGIEKALSAGETPRGFFDPEQSKWVSADEYLSGEVRRKLAAAEAAALEGNIKALEKVAPEPWGPAEITPSLGANWIPREVYSDFLRHIGFASGDVRYQSLTNTYSILSDGEPKVEWQATEPRAWSTVKILEAVMNSGPIRVTYKVTDGDSEKTVVDEDATRESQQKAEELQNEFQDWVFAEDNRRDKLVQIFNNKYNTRVTRQRDGSHLKLPGKNPAIRMRRHQNNAIWRGITDQMVLYDHVVGAGKTFTAIARIMERRRMGLTRKPLIAVPNHLTEQWGKDWTTLYPGAKLLVAGKTDFEKANRRRMFARIAAGDYDGIIIGHSQIGMIPIDPAIEEQYLEEELRAALDAIEEAKEQAAEDGTDSGWRKPVGVAEAERLVNKLEERMAKLRAKTRDRLINFQQMGIDDLTVDEAHEFKNLAYSSRMTNTAGMGNKAGSQKAMDLHMKMRSLHDANNSAAFLTGTPISNSVAEMYLVLRNLVPNQLREMGLENFDAWRTMFVTATSEWEPTEAGGLKEVVRLGREWTNMRTLMDLYYSVSDAVTIDDIKLAYAEDNNGAAFPIPRVKNVKDGETRRLVPVTPGPSTQRILDQVVQGFDSLPYISDIQERNAERLRLMDRARKIALDPRAVDPSNAPDPEGGKIAAVTGELLRIYREWDADKGTQIVFLDRSVPKAKGDEKVVADYDAALEKYAQAKDADDEAKIAAAIEALDKFDAGDIAARRAAINGGWNAYDDIKARLVAEGIPEHEIAFVQSANNDKQKAQLFQKVKDGDVRILIGSTPRMGAGTNVQDRLVALHHVDVTWKPSDIEQREGRIIRQGNRLLEKYGIQDFAVEVIAYATERTVDAKMWDLNGQKLKAINGIRKYDGAFSMEFEDADSASMAEMAALATGNPLMVDRIKLEGARKKLMGKQRTFNKRRNAQRAELAQVKRDLERAPAEIAYQTKLKAELEKQIAAVAKSEAQRSITIDGTTYSTLRDASIAVQEGIDAQQEGTKKRWKLKIAGLDVTTQDDAYKLVRDAFGTPGFEATIAGQKHIDIHKAAEALAAEWNKTRAEQADLRQKSFSAATVNGFPLEVVAAPGFGDRGTERQLVMVFDGQEAFAAYDYKDNDLISTAQFRAYLEKVTEQATAERIDRRIEKARRAEDRGKTRIPELEREVAREFPDQKELDDTNAKLDAVVAALGGTKEKDEDAKASYPAPDSREPVSVLSGDEIGVAGAIRDLRKAGFQWYRRNLAGQKVYSTALGGDVRFSRRGANKSVNAKGEDLVRLIPALRDIIANGQLVQSVAARDGSGFDTLHTIVARVTLGGRPKDVVVTIRQTADQRFHYDLSRDMSGGARFRLDDQRVTARVLQTASLEANTATLNIVEQRPGVNLAAAQSAMESALKEAGIAGKISAELVEGLAVAGRAAQGRYVAGAIAIDPSSADIIGTARHEIVHALRDDKLWNRPYGLFEAGEWQRLVRAARRDKALMGQVKGMYEGLSAAAQVEEAVAERYRRWRAGEEVDSALSKLFKRMRSAMEAIANGLAGAGFRSEAATFRAIAAGEIGARGRDITPGAGTSDPRARIGFTPQAPYVTMKGKKGGLAALTKSLMTRAMIGAHDGDLSLLALVPGRGLLAEMGKSLPGAQRYLAFKEKMDALRNELHNEMDGTAKAWRKILVKDRAANKAMMDLMHESTIKQIDPSLPFVGQSTPRDHELVQKYRGTKTGDSAMQRIREDQQRRALYRDLKQRYDALPAEFRDMYKTVRDEYTKMANKFEDAIMANAQKAMEIGVRRAERAYHKRMEEISEEGLRGKARKEAIAEARQELENAKASNRFAAQARLNALRATFESNRLSGPYFPLARFGRLFATVRDDLGQVISFSRFEKEPDQTAFAGEMRRRGYSVEVGAMADFNPRKVVDPSFVADIEGLMGEIGASPQVMDEIWQRWLHTLPDMSVRTDRIHRKGTPGFDGDAFRAFGYNMSHGAHQLARLTYGIDLQFALEDARADARQAPDPVRADLIVNEMEKRHAFVMNPTGSQLAQKMTTAAFVWYLGITPAAAISNITQTTVVGIPILGAFYGKGGMARASKEITRALGDFTTGKGHAAESRRLTADERSAMAEAYHRGIVDKSQAHDLTGVGETGIEYDRVRTAVMEKIAFFFHHAERMNREITFLAAYRMSRDKGLGHEQAITKAGDLTWRSHFDYQNTSRPRIMQNDFLRVALTFKNFQTNMLWRLFRDIHQSFQGATPDAKAEARRQLIGITASMFLHAGIKGVWGYALLMSLLGMFLPGDGEDIEQEIEQALLSVLPNEAVAAFLQGVPGTLMGIDVTNRWGMPELWFRSPNREMSGQDEYNFWVQEMIGAVPGIAEGIYKGFRMITDEGEAWKGFENMVPKFIRDMSKSVRYTYEGATTYNGNPIVDDFTTGEIIAQFSGFTPARLARQYELNARDKNAEQRIMKARGRALRDARKDIRQGGGLSEDTLDRIRAFNQEYPFYAITTETLSRSIKAGQRSSQNTKDGVYINPRLAPFINSKRQYELYD